MDNNIRNNTEYYLSAWGKIREWCFKNCSKLPRTELTAWSSSTMVTKLIIDNAGSGVCIKHGYPQTYWLVSVDDDSLSIDKENIVDCMNHRNGLPYHYVKTSLHPSKLSDECLEAIFQVVWNWSELKGQLEKFIAKVPDDFKS